MYVSIRTYDRSIPALTIQPPNRKPNQTDPRPPPPRALHRRAARAPAHVPALPVRGHPHHTRRGPQQQRQRQQRQPPRWPPAALLHLPLVLPPPAGLCEGGRRVPVRFRLFWGWGDVGIEVCVGWWWGLGISPRWLTSRCYIPQNTHKRTTNDSCSSCTLMDQCPLAKTAVDGACALHHKTRSISLPPSTPLFQHDSRHPPHLTNDNSRQAHPDVQGLQGRRDDHPQEPAGLHDRLPRLPQLQGCVRALREVGVTD